MSSQAASRPLVVTHIVSGDLWAGAEAQVFQLISGLLRNGRVMPTAVVFNEGVLFDRLKALGIPVEVADETTLSPLRQIGVMRRHFVANRTAIVHTHGFKENILGTIAQHLARVPKSLRTVHGNPETQASWKDPARRLIQIFDGLLARYGQNAVVAVSRQLEQTLGEILPRKTVRISNFIEIDATPPELSPVNPAGSDYRVALVGRMVPVKRVDIFIETLARLRGEHKLPVSGVVFGDGPLLEEMKALAERKAPGAIEFKGFTNDLPDALKSVDALLMPSDHEGLPMSLLEALWHGVPVVAHHVGGIPEVLADGQCGVLVKQHEPKAYAEAMAKLLESPEKRQQFREAGRSQIKKQFGDQENIGRYEELYQALSKNRTVFSLEGQPHPNGPI